MPPSTPRSHACAEVNRFKSKTLSPLVAPVYISSLDLWITFFNIIYFEIPIGTRFEIIYISMTIFYKNQTSVAMTLMRTEKKSLEQYNIHVISDTSIWTSMESLKSVQKTALSHTMKCCASIIQLRSSLRDRVRLRPFSVYRCHIL